MDKTEIETRVKKIIAEHLGVDAAKVVDAARLNEDLGADSLDAVELVMAVEEELGIEVSDEKAEKVNTVAEMVELAAAEYEAQKLKE